jgi:acyl-CoA synthetase (AMP-forming)/AMP-acid ligase II
MFQQIQQYELIDVDGHWYRPRAYGDPQPNGMWDGWLIFFPLGRRLAIAPPGPETTQSTMAALAAWAAGVSPVYLEGALARALELTAKSAVIARLTDAEYEALEDAERFETAAELERTTAELDDAAAKTARVDAERLRRERLATESALAATEEDAAKVEATLHEQAALEARAVAADAERRRRTAQAEATAPTHTKSRGGKKK